jgi:photosystem II stability/assembly factor-like uncharacterized protein
VTGNGNLRYTVDGGITWNLVARDLIGGFSLISFVEEGQGWALNHSGEVWLSEATPGSWRKVGKIPYETAVPPGGGLFQLRFIDSSKGWAKDLSTVWRTSDAGQSWMRLQVELDSVAGGTVLEYAYFHALSAWVFPRADGNDTMRMFSTADGGVSWQEIPQSLNGLDQSSIFRLTENIAWALTEEGRVCKTTDSGRHWKLLTRSMNDFRPTSVFFLTESDGWATSIVADDGRELKEPGGVIFRTFDGGESWTKISSVRGNRFLDRVYFADATHGWLTSFDEVFYTVDGGETYTRVLTVPKSEY